MEADMALKTRPFDAAKYLDDAESQEIVLRDALSTGHAGLIANAIGAIARARGMSALAKETGLSRQSLYAAFSEDGNPTLDTVLKVLHALGLQLDVKQEERELERA
jgi:probable addiction module antidote protein